MYCELATAHWELGNDKEAREAQSRIRIFPMDMFDQPLTRSKYLCTTECHFNKDEYSIAMRVNRERPCRKEGESIEDTEIMKRKLNKCFLDITFEVSEGGYITTSQNVTTPHNFVIRLPHKAIQLKKWYEVVVDIYSDEKRVNKIGVHHQLVYAIEKQIPI